METGETQTPSQPQQLQQPPERGSGQEKEKLKIRVFDEQTKSSLVHFGYSVVQLDDESLQRIAKAAREPKSLKTVVQESFSTLSPTILTSESMLGLHPLRNTEIAFRAEQIYVPQSNLKDYWDAIFPFEVIRDDAGVWEMLTVLPARQKEVLLLRIKAELSILEISEVLKIPEGTVKSRLNKALGTLKKRFTE